MKTKKYILVIAVLICFALIPAVTFAWFFVNDRTPMSFEMLEIQSKVRLYRGNDINNNGIPDLANTETEMDYYTEKYDFEFLSEDSAMTEEKTADIKLNIEITDIVSGQTKTFKLALENTGDADNNIDLSFNLSGLTDSEKEFLSIISVQALKVVKGDGGSYTLEKGEKHWFSDAEQDVLGAVFSDVLPGIATADLNNSPTDIYMDFWLWFYMEPLESVNEHRKTKNQTELTEEQYNSFAGKSAQNLKFYVSFDVTDGN